MIYLILIVSIVLYVALQQPTLFSLGVSDSCLGNAFIYMFAHTSWLHLFINFLSIAMLWVPIRNLYTGRYNVRPITLGLSTYCAAVLAGIVTASQVPTVGMSGCVFFLLGVLLMMNPTKKQLLNYIWLVATVIMQWCFGKSNVTLHLFAFVEGMLFVCIREFIYQYKNHIGLFSPDTV